VDTLSLDLLDPEEARRPPMATKDYSAECKADAAALYESTPGAAYKGIAADLDVNRPTLPERVLRDRDRCSATTADASRVFDLGRQYRWLIWTSWSGSWKPGVRNSRRVSASAPPTYEQGL
jgi:hypothetical protein